MWDKLKFVLRYPELLRRYDKIILKFDELTVIGYCHTYGKNST